MNKITTASVAALLLTATTVWAQKPLTLENTVPGGTEFYEHYNYPVRGQFVSNSDVFVVVEPDGYHVGDNLFSRNQIDKALADNGKQPMSYILGWQNAETVWIHSDKASTAYGINLKNNAITDSITQIDNEGDIDFAPDFRHAAVSVNPDLFVSGNTGNHKVNEQAGDGIVFGQSVHRNEFGIEKGTFWSESGKRLAFYRMDESMVGEYPVVDITAREAALAPIRYPMAGETSHEVKVGIYNVENHDTLYLKTASPVNRYFTNIAWSPDDQFLFVAEINREQNHMWLNQYNAADGSLVKTLFEETSPEWVEPCFAPFFVSNSQFVWISERDGFKHLYLFDIKTLKTKQLTRGNWCVTDLYGCNRESGEVFFQANAEGYLTRDIYKVNLKGKMTRLSNGYGVHSAWFSPKYGRFVDNFSAPNYAILSTLCDTRTGAVIDTLKSVRNTYEGYTLPIIKTVRISD